MRYKVKKDCGGCVVFGLIAGGLAVFSTIGLIIQLIIGFKGGILDIIVVCIAILMEITMSICFLNDSFETVDTKIIP
jgi:hypothetical protein